MRCRETAVVISLFVAAIGVPLSATQKPTPILGIVELGTGTEIKWADVKKPNVTIPLTIENLTKGPIENIDVMLTPFSGSGRAADATIDGKEPPATIKLLRPSIPVTITIAAQLPAPVTYRAYLRLRQGGAAHLLATIEIARTRSPPPIEIGTVQARIVEFGFRLCPQSAIFDTTITDQGDSVKLNYVRHSIEYREKADGKEPIAPPGHVDVIIEPSSLLAGATPLPVKMTVAGISRPGRYDATVGFGGPSYSATDMTAVVYARQSWYVAISYILLGTLVSLFLRYYGIVGRPSLLKKQRMNTLFRELAEHATAAADDPPALAVVQNVRRQLTDFWNELSITGKLKETVTLDVYDAKIAAMPQWLQLRRQIKRLQPETLREPFEVKISGVESVLRDRTAETAAVTAQIKILDAMPAEIDAALKTELETQLTALMQSVAGDTRFEDLVPLLGKVRTELGAGRLEGAAVELDLLQRRYVRRLADDLAARLTPTSPVGVKKPEWDATVATIMADVARARNAATAAEALEAFRSGLTRFLHVVATGLNQDIAEKIKKGSRFGKEYASVNPRLDAVLAALDQGDLVVAWRRLDEAQTDYAKVVREATAGVLGDGEQLAMNALAAATNGSGASAGFDIVDIFVGRSSADEVSRPESMKSIRTMRLAGDIAASLFVILAANLIGLQTLWIGNLTWGGWPAVIAAFLWGVAFDQFSHAGLSALIRKG